LATGGTVKVTTGIDVEAYLTGIIDVAISELTVMADHLGAKTKTNLNAISDAKCVHEISQIGSIGAALTTSNLKDLTKVAVDCAGQVVDLGALGALQGALAVAAGLVASVFETAFLGATDIIGGPAGPSAVIATSRSAVQSVPAEAPPVLGIANWRPDATGYGQVAPSDINNAGDPTGVINGVSWRNWGASQAIGTGTASYQAPGQVAADATPAQATAVAFNLGTCGGVPAYENLEWYFPEYGQSFDPSNAFSICTPEFAN